MCVCVAKVGIWDRTLDLEEAAATLFKMPQGLPAKENALGQAGSCLEKSRILYARWNGVTCSKAGVAPMLPAETCDSSFRMKTQVVCMAPASQVRPLPCLTCSRVAPSLPLRPV